MPTTRHRPIAHVWNGLSLVFEKPPQSRYHELLNKSEEDLLIWSTQFKISRNDCPARKLSHMHNRLEPLVRHCRRFGSKPSKLHKNGSEYILHVGISASAGKLKAITAKLSGRVDHFKIPITSSDIDRLDAEGRSRRGSASGGPTANLSLSLRVLGDFLDEKRAVTFSISWSPHLVIVQYQTPHGSHRVQDFTTANLYDRAVHKLGVQMYLRRS
jgi:hypothetical protein